MANSYVRLKEEGELRRHAEKLYAAPSPPAGATGSDPEAGRLMHELQVHKIELEMQNAELCRIRGELELALQGYTDLYTFAPIGYFSLYRDATIRTANLSGAGLLGIDRSRLIGRDFVDFVSSGTRRSFDAFLLRILEQSLDASCEVSLLRVGRESLSVRIEAALCQSGHDCLIMVIDTTREKQALFAQQQSEAQFELIFNATLDAIFIVALDGRLLEVNETACRSLDYSREELLAMNLNDIDLPEYADLLPARIREILQQGTLVFEWVHLARGGEQIPLEVNSRIIQFQGRPAILGVARDITERKLAELAQLESKNLLERRVAARTAELTEANLRIKLSSASEIRLETQLHEAKKLEAIGQLAAGVAHEVRNPLNAILSLTEALFRERGMEANPEYDPYITHIRSQVGRLSQLMTDLLELGRPIPASRLLPVPLLRICRETVALLASSGSSADHRITVEALPGYPDPLVLADPVKLQQVLFNAMENALQHTPKGGKVVLQLVDAGGIPGSGMALVRIADAGQGIPADRVGRVFEPFYTGRKGGTGLGLTLVRHFIEHMGGTVTIANNVPPPGCSVEIRIPLAGGEGL